MPAPHQIGPYRIVRPLGQGGMGAVYLATDARLGRAVALKVFSAHDASLELARHELLNEARAAANVNHPHIAAVYDVLDVDGQVAIVFEYVEGETLAACLARGPLPMADAIAIALQLTDALAAAHQRGIVHRDLKPANVVMTGSGVVKVLDFGIARVMPDGASPASAARTTASRFVGTVGYAAPEQCVGESVDARADIFALGVVLFEMVTGRRPFDGATAPDVVRAMLSGAPLQASALARDLPAALDQLLARMLARNAADRPATADDVARALRTLRTALLTTAPASPPSLVRASRRAGIAGIAVMMVVSAALVTTVLWRSSGSRASDEPPVVAVLTLTNASSEATNDYVAVGVADTLVTRLAAVPAVTVLSRAAVSEAAARAVSRPALAAELDADYVVDGSVQQAGDTLRISLNLVRADASVAWADTVEGSVRAMFELQTRLASTLAQALSVQLSAADRASLARQPTHNADALAAYWRGRALMDRRDVRGNVDKALDAFEQAVTFDASYAEAHAAIGEAQWARYQDQRDPAAAKAAIDAGHTALRLNPSSALVRYVLAVTLAGTGRLSEAEDELMRALALQPNFDDARVELGNVLARQGKLDAAVAEMRKAIAIRPNYWRHYSALGLRYYQAARYEDAAASFRRVIELQSDNAQGYQQLGTVLQALGRDDEALEQYRRATNIQPSPPAFSNMGTLHYRRGEFAAALDAYNASLALRPNSAIGHRNRGDTLRRLNRSAEAVVAYREALRLTDASLAVDPRDVTLLASAAVYAAKAGDAGSAAQRIQRARELAPEDVQVLYRAAVVHALLGEATPALDALEKAVAAGYSRTEIGREEDFGLLRGNARFKALLTEAAPGGSPP
jgi:eukaryotic-like serine/threonine-protein kinase